MRGNTIQIELPLKRGKVSKTIPLYQYDYGQNLVITGAELPDAYEVHFANEMHGEAVTAIGGSTGVAIPDSVLTSGDPIYLWLYLHEDSTDGETEFQGVIPVIKRASISDQTPTPAEQSAITEAIAALNSAVTQTTAAKNAAVAAQTHIENMTVSGTSTGPDTSVTVTKTVNAQGEVNLAFSIPRGDKGDKGDQGVQGEPGTNGTNGTNGVSPVVSMSKSNGTTTLSITDATHTDTVEIKDGEAGDPSELIDDDAGSGDTDVTWSANKLANLNETVSGKADLVSSPTEGNFAALSSGGNLVDSGHKHSDYLTSHQDITGKADKVSSAVNGNFAGLDSNGNLTDSGSKAADFLTSHQDISGKSDLTNLAAAFSSSATYAVGDHVTYNGKYYVCSTAISTAGAWDSSKWTEKTVGTENQSLLTEINSKADEDVLDEIVSVVIGSNLFDNNFDESGYIDSNGDDQPGSNWIRTSTYYPIDDSHSTLYSYNQDSGGTTNIYFYTSAKVFISKADIAGASHSKSIPEGAAYFRLYRNATKTQPITLTYEYKGQYEPYGLVVTMKSGVVHYATLDAEMQAKIDAITTATETATAAQQAVAELIVNKATANLFDSDFDESGYIDDANGDKPSNNYVRTSKYYPVDDSNAKIYSYNPDNGNTTELLFYTAGKVFISRVDIESKSTSKNIPEGAAYFRLYRNNYKTQPITITYTYENRTIPYIRWSEVKENMVGYDSVNLEGKRMLGSVLAGRKILVFGDSIIGNDRTEGVCDFLAEYSGATVYNGAVGGTRITDLRSSQYDTPNLVYFDGVKLVHALMTNTWTDQDAHTSDAPSYVAEATLPMLKALDCTTLDVIVIAYGRNDVTSSETTANIESALATIIDDIQSTYPNIRILVLTPVWGMFTNKTVDGDEYVNSTTNMTLRILADTLTAKAKAKHVASIDMLENMQLSQNMMATYMDSDEVHLNSAGNAMYAHILNGKLRSMF